VTGLFMDRDGVINENRAEYVTRLDQFQFLPGALDALADAASYPFKIMVVTNQAAVGRGFMSREALDGIHRQMRDRVHAHGGRIDDIYVCPHRRDEGCACRKPRPGLLYRAAQEHKLDLERSYFIGDAVTDVLAALAAGCRPILVLSGLGREARDKLTQLGVHRAAYEVAPDVRAAVRSVSQAEAVVRGDLHEWPGGDQLQRLVTPVA